MPVAKRVIRDGQKSKVYAAERATFPDTYNPKPKAMTVAEVQAYVDKLLREQWTRRRWGNRQVAVTDGRGRRSAVSMDGEIRLPLWARDPVTILHELAHELAPREEWHGAIFTRTYLELVGHRLGLEAQTRLRAEFKAKRVKVGGVLPLRPLERVPAAPPLPVPPKLWRIEYKLDGQVKQTEITSSTMQRALYQFVSGLGLNAGGNLTNLRCWRGVRRTATTTAVARKKSPGRTKRRAEVGPPAVPV